MNNIADFNQSGPVEGGIVKGVGWCVAMLNNRVRFMYGLTCEWFNKLVALADNLGADSWASRIELQEAYGANGLSYPLLRFSPYSPKLVGSGGAGSV